MTSSVEFVRPLVRLSNGNVTGFTDTGDVPIFYGRTNEGDIMCTQRPTLISKLSSKNKDEEKISVLHVPCIHGVFAQIVAFTRT